MPKTTSTSAGAWSSAPCRAADARWAGRMAVVMGPSCGRPVPWSSPDADEPPGAARARVRSVAPDPLTLLRSPAYVKLLVLAALIGVPVSAVAYGFLKLVAWLEEALFEHLPGTLGFDRPPTWWPVPLLAVSGVIVALAIRRL